MASGVLITGNELTRLKMDFLRQYQNALICVSMNHMGISKRGDNIDRCFDIGLIMLERQFLRIGKPATAKRIVYSQNGNTALFAIDADERTIIEIAEDLASTLPFKRLLRLDAMDISGHSLFKKTGGTQELLHLCDKGTKHLCPPGQIQSEDELRKIVATDAEEVVTDFDSREIAAKCTRALLYEVNTTPKPGLVDRRNSGSHLDMDIFTFANSVSALYPYFEECVRIGIQTKKESPDVSFRKLRSAGKLAEAEMLAVTDGVNTHKGAIFCLGLVAGALGRLEAADRKCPERVLSEVMSMTKGLVNKDLSGVTADSAVTNGQKLYAMHGIKGAREQAELGFPAALIGMKVLEAGLQQGYSMDIAGCAALLTILSEIDDTNLIHRSDFVTQQAIKKIVAALVAETRYPSQQTLKKLDDFFIANNLSAGGSADQLAVSYLLHFVNET